MTVYKHASYLFLKKRKTYSAILSCLRYLSFPALRLFPSPATTFCLLAVSWKPAAASLAAGQIKRSSCTPICQELGYLPDDVMCPVF